MKPNNEPGLLGKITALAGGGVVLVLGFMFSAVLLIVLALAGLVVWAYLWWKTRALRKAMREQYKDGQIFDGEAIIVENSRTEVPHIPPNDRDTR